MSVTATPQALEFYEKAGEIFIGLYCRWRDEYKYEDINDYMGPLKPLAESCGVSLVKMKKQPFSVVFNVDEKQFILQVSNRGQYSYKRIK